jgi:hypothetical protein
MYVYCNSSDVDGQINYVSITISIEVSSIRRSGSL